MEFSKIFGFLIILSESIKLVPKNGKFMASITILSLLLPSILVLLFSFFYQSLTNNMTNSIMKSSEADSSYNSYQQIIIYLALLLFVEIAFLFVLIAISYLSEVATILVSAMSYTGKKLSLQDLYFGIKTTWRRTSFRRSKNPTRYASVAVMTLAASLAIIYGNPLTIFVAIVVGISVFVFELYSSVVWTLSYVISIVEESCEGMEALKKAEQLVKGQRLHGFMVNLFINVMLLIILLGYWIIMVNKEYLLNMTVYGLFFVNSFSMAKIFGCVVYTVFYFRCKKHHGEDIDVLGNFEYAKLATTELGSNIP